MMGYSIPSIFWTFPVGFSIRDIEETLWLPAFSNSAERYHRPVETIEFWSAGAIMTSPATIITILFYFAGKQSVPCYLSFGFRFRMLINLIFPHLAATIAPKNYCPE